MVKSKTSKRYTPEFRRQMVELVRAGRKPQELSRECGSTARSICLWVKQADRDVWRIVVESKGTGGPEIACSRGVHPYAECRYCGRVC